MGCFGTVYFFEPWGVVTNYEIPELMNASQFVEPLMSTDVLRYAQI